MASIQIADSDEKILKCWQVIHLLRPHLKEAEFLELIKKMQKEKYRLLFIEEDGIAASALGFVSGINLHRGNYIYIDDLATLPNYRRKGLANALLDWVFDFAKKNKIEQVHLDSGVQRYPAHRLYLKYGFNITSHHFVKESK
jgi:ribosomal protein S18 acetylase RimI-like enzyme